MSVFVIADLHLSHSTNKPMDIFGSRWENHTQRIWDNFCRNVTENDTTVIAGDISWGMKFESAYEDLAFVHSLPGKKIVLKGNHDFWWQSMKKLDEYKEKSGADSISFLFNNAYFAENIIICGTRGWTDEESATAKDKKVIAREVGRLKLSVEQALLLKEQNPNAEIYCFMHYPPTQSFTEVMRENGIKKCYYGHLHGVFQNQLPQHIGGVECHLISADYINFNPVRL